MLELRLVEVRDEEDGEGEPLLLLDCPRGDFHTAVTRQDFAAAVTAAVVERLRG